MVNGMRCLGYADLVHAQLYETIAFAFSIMGVCAAVSTTFAFPLASGV